MGLTRRRLAPPKSDHDKLASNRASRPWDNTASYPNLPKLPAPQPIRPPRPRSPSEQRFVPLLRSPNLSPPPPIPPGMTASPRSPPQRSATSFTPVATAAFQMPTRAQGRAPLPISPPRGLSVSDRMRLFENPDQSVRERVSPQVLRKSPFRGALEAFGGPVQLQMERASSSASEADEQESHPLHSPPHHPLPLKTRIGNREISPLVTAPKPPPLVGLPIPMPSKSPPPEKENVHPGNPERLNRGSIRARGSMRAPIFTPMETAQNENTRECIAEGESDTASSHDTFSDFEVSQEEPEERVAQPASGREHVNVPALPAEDLSDIPAANQRGVSDLNMDLEDPGLIPRFSYRHSVRLPSVPSSSDIAPQAAKSSFRNSTRLPMGDSDSHLSFLPKSSSFLHFEDDERLAALTDENTNEVKSEATSKGASGWGDLSFDDPDTFDTFGTLPTKDLKLGAELKATLPDKEDPRPGSNESEKPSFPMMSFTKKTAAPGVDDAEDGTLDVPNRYTRRPGAEGALKELQRASVTAGNEIAASLRMMGEQEAAEPFNTATTKDEKVSKVQGDVFVRSRIFRRWNLRYASIVHQGYFGAVLLLFRPDSKGGLGGAFSLRSSKMIALADSSVRKVENSRKAGGTLMFELKTSERTYMFACKDEEGREFWMKNLSR